MKLSYINSNPLPYINELKAVLVQKRGALRSDRAILNLRENMGIGKGGHGRGLHGSRLSADDVVILSSKKAIIKSHLRYFFRKLFSKLF